MKGGRSDNWEVREIVFVVLGKTDGKFPTLLFPRHCPIVLLLNVVNRHIEESGSEEGHVVGSGLLCGRGSLLQQLSELLLIF